MTEMSWDVLYRPARSSSAEPAIEPARPAAFLRSWEAWLTLVLIVFLQFPVVGSLESANWVSEMPSLIVPALTGVIGGWLLANLPWRAAWLHALGMAGGVAVVFGSVLHTMRLEDPLLGTGLETRWTELWARLGAWGEAAIDGGISGDPLPFVLLLVLLVWAVAYVSAWAVVRWQNAWAALVPGGFVLLTNISYLPGQPSFAFIVFLFAAVLLVARMHFLQSLVAWRREHVALPEFMSVEVLFSGVWIGLALIVFAWAIPTANEWGPIADRWIAALEPVNDRLDRLGRLFVGVGSKKDLPAHAFGDVFPLQGRLALDNDVLLEVIADSGGNLRGAVYDEYTGSGWKVSDASPFPLDGTSVEAAQFGTPETREQIREPVTAEITVVGEVPDRRLLSIGVPIAADADSELLAGASRSDVLAVVPRDRVGKGDTYTSVGTVSVADVQRLAASGRDYPPDVLERYTQLPDHLSAEVGQLAADVAGDGAPFELARRIEQFLRDEYPFDLAVSDPPPRRDVVEYFLFDAHRGYFDYHASAMVVMLRTLDIPARVATGFALDEADLDPETKTYLVSERRAWAWPEVYFAGLGWVEFNPTPVRPLVARALDDSDFVQRSQDFDLDALSDQFEELLLAELAAQERGEPLSPDQLSSEDGRLGELVARAITVFVLGSLVMLVVALLVRLGWEYEFRGMSPPTRRWAKLQRLASWAGRSPRATLTPLEITTDLSPVLGEPAALTRLARSYTRARYGGPGGGESETEARERDQDYRSVRARLWRLVLGRLLPGRMRGTPRSPGSAGRRERVVSRR